MTTTLPAERKQRIRVYEQYTDRYAQQLFFESQSFLHAVEKLASLNRKIFYLEENIQLDYIIEEKRRRAHRYLRAANRLEYAFQMPVLGTLIHWHDRYDDWTQARYEQLLRLTRQLR